MMARVMGVREDDEETLDRACDLGSPSSWPTSPATCRDDDAAGRCYLPLEWLAEADIPPGEHMKPAYREQLVALVARLLDSPSARAAARVGAERLAFRQRWAVLRRANIYGAIGARCARAARGVGPPVAPRRCAKLARRSGRSWKR
jgi:phytoene synthase